VGDVDRKLDAMKLADGQENDLVYRSPVYLNNLCWFGTLWGRAKDVITYCRKAQEISKGDINIGDSLALALSEADRGNGPEAISLFERYISAPVSSDEEKKKRHEWIVRIRAGNRPLTQQDRRSLISQGLSNVAEGCKGGVESACLAFKEAQRRATALR
jgi:hypothetical protein